MTWFWMRPFASSPPGKAQQSSGLDLQIDLDGDQDGGCDDEKTDQAHSQVDDRELDVAFCPPGRLTQQLPIGVASGGNGGESRYRQQRLERPDKRGGDILAQILQVGSQRPGIGHVHAHTMRSWRRKEVQRDGLAGSPYPDADRCCNDYRARRFLPSSGSSSFFFQANEACYPSSAGQAAMARSEIAISVAREAPSRAWTDMPCRMAM